jgi:hypothetical protein
VAAPLLVARAAPPPPQQAPDREAPPVAQVFRHTAPPPRPAYAVSAFVEAGLSSDGALWRGVRGHGCLTVGRLCLGAQAGYAEDLRDGGDSQALETARWAFDLLVTADLPLQTGRFALSPGVAAGLTTFKAEREVPRGDAEDITAGLLLRGHVAGELRFGEAWWLRLDLAFGYAPFADSRLGDPADPLAGEPKTQGSVGLGLTYRAP